MISTQRAMQSNGQLPKMTKDQLEANIQRIADRDRAARGLGDDDLVITRKATPEELRTMAERDARRPLDQLLEQPIRRPIVTTPKEDPMPTRERVRTPCESRQAEPIVTAPITRVRPTAPTAPADDPPAPAFVNRSRDHVTVQQPDPEPRPDLNAIRAIEDEPEPVAAPSAMDELLAEGFVEAPSRSLLGYQPLMSVSSKGELTFTKAAVALLGRYPYARVLVDPVQRRLAIVGSDQTDGARPVHMIPSGSVRINAQNALRLFDPPVAMGRYPVRAWRDGAVVVELSVAPVGRTGQPV